MLLCYTCGSTRPESETDGAGVSLGAPCAWIDCRGTYRDPVDASVPSAVINAVVVRAMLDERYDEKWAAVFGDDYQHCDMRPVVFKAFPIDPAQYRGDMWYVEVQYSSKGGRAGYGVNRDHVPSCYID